METLVTLEPRHDPNEILMSGLEQRKQLELRGSEDDSTISSLSLVLGRGVATGIRDNSIGSSVLELSLGFSSGEASLRATLSRDAGRCKVHVNGRPFKQTSMFLNSGDMISLDGLRYEYRVHITQLTGSASAPGSDPLGGDLGLDSEDFWDADSHLAASSPENTKSEPGISVSSTNCSQLADELQCSVCLEIQVNSRTIHPCGHSVCAVCVTKLTDCPQCRVKINSHIPNLQLDSLICKLVSIPSLLDKEDVESYNERKKNAKVFAAVDLTSMSGKKRSRPSSSSRSTRNPSPNIGGAIGRRGISAFHLAFGDSDEEFYMPPHLGPHAAAAASARIFNTVSAARARASANLLETETGIRSFDSLNNLGPMASMFGVSPSDRIRQRVGHRGPPPLPPPRHPPPPRQPPNQAGSSLENAISID